MEYVIDNGIKVSNNSWGAGTYSQALHDVIEASQAVGHIFVAAAGNNYGNDNDRVLYYPASYDLPNIIAVAATDNDDNLAGFSNYGLTTVDLGAPGVNIYSTVLNAGYEYKQGTSMATPHVTGVVALIQSRVPDASRQLVRELLLATARPVDALAGITVSGGVLNAGAAITDCNGNGVPDGTDIATGTSEDCTENTFPDECEPDCNGNGAADTCDLASGVSGDCNFTVIPDECEPGGDQDCNNNENPDLCDIYEGLSEDCNRNAIPDDCEPDCNGNGVPDDCDIFFGTSADCNTNDTPDDCDIDGELWPDRDNNGVLDSCEARVLFVHAGATGPRNGLDWAGAFIDLQDALNIAANSGNAVREIWVAAGTYVPTKSPQARAGPRTATFQLIDNVALYGGFCGNETSRQQRDPAVNETILSGDLNGDDVLDPGSNCCTAHAAPGCDDPACEADICVHRPECCDVEWDGDCAESARYNCPDVCDYRVGDNAYHVVASISNTPGAVLDGFTITAGNAAGERGCTWSDNSGGGLHISYSAPTIRNCRFVNNAATGSAAEGGAVYVHSEASAGFAGPVLTGCTFVSNRSVFCGGGLANDNGRPVLQDCVFIGNEANYGGGGVASQWQPIELYRCIFVANSAGRGGGLFDFDGSYSYNCAFIGNTADFNGGGMSFMTAQASVVNCTFAGNAAPDGNAIGCDTNPPSMGGDLAVKNSILWDGPDAVWIGDSSTVSITHSNIPAGWDGVGNISDDPLFLNPAGDDCVVGSADDNLRLSAGSPCIDAGNNNLLPPWVSTDLDGTARFTDDPPTADTGAGIPPIVDMGAYEYADCNTNLISDWQDIHVGASADCAGEGVPDECEPDCNANGAADSCDIADGASDDCDGGGVPDECEPDCDENGTPDVCELPPFGRALDCNGNEVPDACEIVHGTSDDCNADNTPDDCEPDCNENGVADACDIANATSDDCTSNGVPDECETLPDCNGNAIADHNDICHGTAADANHNGAPDECDLIVFVDADATGDQNGANWVDAFTDLQDALHIASDPANGVTEVWVAAGTYTPSARTDPDDPRSATFQLITGVSLYGGFAGGEIRLDARNHTLNETILSGDIARNDDPDGWGNRSDNAYHVVTGSGTDASAVLDGFTVTSGSADGEGNHGSGGGVYNYRGDPILVNCVIAENLSVWGSCSLSRGAGMYNSYASPTLINCTIRENLGEGMYNNRADPLLVGVRFLANSNRGLYDWLSQTLLVNCIFGGNTTTGSGGAIFSGIAGTGNAATLVNCTIVNNVAAEYGGGIFCGGPGGSGPTLVNCILWGNGGTREVDQISGGAPAISHSCIQGWSGLFGGIGNFGDDPGFVNGPPHGAQELRLAVGSACIDAGDNRAVPADIADLDGDHNTTEPLPFDYGGTPRFYDDPFTPDTGLGRTPLVDIGAWEYGQDCNNNGIPDDLDIAGGVSQDCNSNGIPDECEPDCNENGVADGCDIADGTEEDCNGNGIPDVCLHLELDCNDNLHPDACDLAEGASDDCNHNGVPDECDMAEGTSGDCNGNGVPDDCEPDEDCNVNEVQDICDIAAGTSHDCNATGVPDECEDDCNGNGFADECDLAAGTSLDCNANGIPDECDIASGFSPDCTGDGVPDECVVFCIDDCECHDRDICTFDACVDGTCVNPARDYGDTDRNGAVNVFDVFGILDAIGGDFTDCPFEEADIHPCEPNGVLNIFDVFAVLDAIAGRDPCCS